MKNLFFVHVGVLAEKNTFKISIAYPILLKASGTFFGMYSKLFLNLGSLPVANPTIPWEVDFSENNLLCSRFY